MYYVCGGDLLNFSVGGLGNVVLIKFGYFWLDCISDYMVLEWMQSLNLDSQGWFCEIGCLCVGQILLCKVMGLKVLEWDVQCFDLQ